MSSEKHTKFVNFYAGLTNLSRREKFFAERFVVVGSRDLSALVVDVRTHPINTVLGLLLGEGLERERQKKRVERLIRGWVNNRAIFVKV